MPYHLPDPGNAVELGGIIFDRHGIEMPPQPTKRSKPKRSKRPLAPQRKRALHDLSEVRRMPLHDLESARDSALRQHAAAISTDPDKALSLNGWIVALHDEIERRNRDAVTPPPPPPRPASRELPLEQRVASAKQALDPSRATHGAREQARDIMRQLRADR